MVKRGLLNGGCNTKLRKSLGKIIHCELENTIKVKIISEELVFLTVIIKVKNCVTNRIIFF